MGLYTPTILGGDSYLSWFYDRGAIKDPAHTGTSKWLSQAINESMVSLVLRQYMRGENGTESLMVFFSVLLIRIGKQNVKIIEK